MEDNEWEQLKQKNAYILVYAVQNKLKVAETNSQRWEKLV